MNRRSIIYYDEMDSPIGPLTLFATEAGLCNIEFGTFTDTHLAMEKWAKKVMLVGEFVQDRERLEQVTTQLSEYFAGNRTTFDMPLDLHGTSFQQKVWEELLKVSYGETKAYKDIAQGIAAPKAVRAVGGAVNRNPLPIIVPCHRIIGSNGALVGYNGGLDKKVKLLEIENISAKLSS